MPSQGIEYSIAFSTTEKAIEDFLDSAFSGGIAYWADVNIGPEETNLEATIIDLQDDGKEYKFSREKFFAGLAVAANEYSSHFADWVNGRHDAITADVIVQCAIFGEIVYG